MGHLTSAVFRDHIQPRRKTHFKMPSAKVAAKKKADAKGKKALNKVQKTTKTKKTSKKDAKKKTKTIASKAAPKAKGMTISAKKAPKKKVNGQPLVEVARKMKAIEGMQPQINDMERRL